jgi:hypothetical protein
MLQLPAADGAGRIKSGAPATDCPQVIHSLVDDPKALSLSKKRRISPENPIS